MHEGLTHDDIYLMVEDEFLATAQLFTSHLHHAEYVRLKNAAKARNGSLYPAANGLTRPTDSITTMRAETKKKKEAELRSGKNKAALDKMKSDARANIDRNSDDDDNDDEEDADEEQPWVGTSLHGLMAPAARKNLTSLSGLQKIQSSTRAANGYRKPDDASQSNKTARNISPPPRPPQHPSSSKIDRPTLRRLSDMSSSGTESSDDLDALSTRAPTRTSSTKTNTASHPPAPSKSANRPPTISSIKTNTNNGHIPKPSNPLSLAASDLFHPSSSNDKKPHVPHNNPSPLYIQKQNRKKTDPSPPSRNDEVAAARRRLEERRQRAAAAVKRMDEKTNEDVNVNVNEIPVFLV
ncbi:MAG: hypothetical protein Q9168_006298 [Polycauliona sp. 1 TL-2023]